MGINKQALMWLCAAAGAALALLLGRGVEGASWLEGLAGLDRRLGDWLRQLSLSGTGGNLAAWALVLAVCAPTAGVSAVAPAQAGETLAGGRPFVLMVAPDLCPSLLSGQPHPAGGRNDGAVPRDAGLLLPGGFGHPVLHRGGLAGAEDAAGAGGLPHPAAAWGAVPPADRRGRPDGAGGRLRRGVGLCPGRGARSAFRSDHPDAGRPHSAGGAGAAVGRAAGGGDGPGPVQRGDCPGLCARTALAAG